MATMKAVVFRGTNEIAIEERPKPRAGAGQAVIRITSTTICGTDVHIVKGEYPVRPGLILGHEPVGVIDELGAGLDDVKEAYQVFSQQEGGVLKVAIHPHVDRGETLLRTVPVGAGEDQC